MDRKNIIVQSTKLLHVASVDGITAETLNNHYAAVSTDTNYTASTRKRPTEPTIITAFVSDWQVFTALDSL